MSYEEKTINVRYNVPQKMHDKVLQIQGLFSFEKGKKVFVQDTYIRLVEIGIAEVLKRNNK